MDEPNSKRKSHPIILPPLDLTTLDSITEQICGNSKLITPHTPPSDNPSALNRDKVKKQLSEKSAK